MLQILVAVVALVVVVDTVAAESVVFKDCGSVSGTIHTVDITPCPAEPCALGRNQTASVVVTFSAKVQITKATTQVYGIILGAKIPFPVPEDACQDMTCPVSEGATTVYKNSVFVKPEFPNVKLVVQWEVKDQDGKDIMCFLVPVKITG